MAFTIRYEVSHFYPPYLLFFMMGFWLKIFFANLKLNGFTYQANGKVNALNSAPKTYDEIITKMLIVLGDSNF